VIGGGELGPVVGLSARVKAPRPSSTGRSLSASDVAATAETSIGLFAVFIGSSPLLAISLVSRKALVLTDSRAAMPFDR
jgi:hypothetical protein